MLIDVLMHSETALSALNAAAGQLCAGRRAFGQMAKRVALKCAAMDSYTLCTCAASSRTASASQRSPFRWLKPGPLPSHMPRALAGLAAESGPSPPHTPCAPAASADSEQEHSPMPHARAGLAAGCASQLPWAAPVDVHDAVASAKPSRVDPALGVLALWLKAELC